MVTEMSERRQLPHFASESEEADWWYENREKHAEDFVQAIAEGRVTRNGLKKRLEAARAMTTIALDTEDVSKAKALAERRGMEVASYLQLLVHEALEREEQSAA